MLFLPYVQAVIVCLNILCLISNERGGTLLITENFRFFYYLLWSVVSFPIASFDVKVPGICDRRAPPQRTAAGVGLGPYS